MYIWGVQLCRHVADSENIYFHMREAGGLLLCGFFFDMKESFLVYKEWNTLIESLEDDDRLFFYDTLFNFDGEEIPIFKSKHLQSVVNFVFGKIIENDKKYSTKCEKAKESANKRWNANASESMRTHANVKKAMHNDNVNDNVNDNDKKGKQPPKKKKETTPEYFFSETPEGMNFDIFREKWNETNFAELHTQIDPFILWGTMRDWSNENSPQKNKRSDWIAVGRTFVKKDPKQFTKSILPHGATDHLNTADRKGAEILSRAFARIEAKYSTSSESPSD